MIPSTYKISYLKKKKKTPINEKTWIKSSKNVHEKMYELKGFVYAK